MSKLSILGCIICLLISCSKPEYPMFQKLDNVRVKDLSVNNVTVLADAEYFNPNVISLKVKSSSIKVKANEVDVGIIEQKYSIEAKAKENFKVPLEISFPPKKIFAKDSGLFSSVLQVLGNKKVDLDYQGKITMDVGGIDIDIPIDFQKEVKLKGS